MLGIFFIHNNRVSLSTIQMNSRATRKASHVRHRVTHENISIGPEHNNEHTATYPYIHMESRVW